jgi:hypothetical protein
MMVTVLSTKSALYLFLGASDIFANPARLPEHQLVWCGTKSDEVLSLAHRSSDGEQERMRNLLLVDAELFVQVGSV